MPLDPTLPFASQSSPLRLEAEHQSAYDAWKLSPTPQTRGAVLRSVQPVIDTALKSYGGAGASSPSLRSQARLESLKALQSYDPSRSSLKNHLLSHLRRLQRIGGQEAQAISVPERVARDRQWLHEAEQELSLELGRDPSDAELADRSGVSLKRLGYIRQARPAVALGSVLAASQSEGGPEAPASSLPGDRSLRDAWEELIYHDLSATDQAVLDHLQGRRGRRRLSVSEIARRLGVTPSAVSQRATKIQALLDERLGAGVFGS